VRTAIPRVLADLSRAFRAEGVRWYVFGAQAVAALGVPRLTADVDVTVAASRQQLPGLLVALKLGQRCCHPAHEGAGRDQDQACPTQQAAASLNTLGLVVDHRSNPLTPSGVRSRVLRASSL
jgi:hypothetical protein